MLQDSQAATQFVDRLIEEKGLQGLDAEIREQLRKDLLRRLEDRINRAVVDALNAQQVAQLEHIIDTNQVDKIQDFLYKQGVNVNGLIAKVMTEFHASYLEA
jgi:hypothetical protein